MLQCFDGTSPQIKLLLTDSGAGGECNDVPVGRKDAFDMRSLPLTVACLWVLDCVCTQQVHQAGGQHPLSLCQVTRSLGVQCLPNNRPCVLPRSCCRTSASAGFPGLHPTSHADCRSHMVAKPRGEAKLAGRSGASRQRQLLRVNCI